MTVPRRDHGRSFKLVINLVATTVLLVYLETFSYMAAVAADPNAELGVVRNPSPLIHAALALLLLISPRATARFGRSART